MLRITLGSVGRDKTRTPVFLCDHCQQEIDDASMALYRWHIMRGTL